ncbi:hypothetical protein [Marinicauda pacifica]|uniref:hypothetical protein n=1 Tax=Marinicauda pacifica TaxID=1133559 RepID=UPI0035C7BE61
MAVFDRLAQVNALRQGYESNGWALAQHLFPTEVVDSLLYQFQTDLGGCKEDYKGRWEKGPFTNAHCFESYAYDYPAQATMLWSMTPWMQALTGKELLPAHSYFRVYRKGDICKLHLDRCAAEQSISLTLGYSDDIEWPLWVSEQRYEDEVKKNVHGELLPAGQKLSFYKVPMKAGDAVIYKGMNHIHGRNDPNPNTWSAHLFLHWVDKNGSYAEHAFDGNAETVVRKARFEFPEAV